MTATKKKSSVRLQRIALSEADFEALKSVTRKYNLRYMAVGLRFCIDQQDARDRYFEGDESARADILGNPPAARPYKKLFGAIKATVGFGRKVPRVTALGQWSVWLYEKQEKDLAEIGRRWGLDSTIDCIRLAFRIQATLSGYKPPGKQW